MFHTLPDDILIEIYYFTQLEQAYHLYLTANYIYKTIGNLVITNMKCKKNMILNLFTPNIISIMGMRTLLFAPILTFQSWFITFDGIVKYINPPDMHYPIMIGVANGSRPFIALKTIHLHSDRKHHFDVKTLYQQYTNVDRIWAVNHFLIPSVYNSDGTEMDEDEIKKNLHTCVYALVNYIDIVIDEICQTTKVKYKTLIKLSS